MPALASAAEGTSVVIRYGDYLVELPQVVGSLAVALFPVAVALLPAPLRLVVSAVFGEQPIRDAGDYALNAIEGAAKGKILAVDVGNQVLAQAVEYAVRERAHWLVRLLGGPEGIRLKIFRLLDHDEQASAEELGLAVPQK
ncbi:hypothetical protein ACD578_10170 [Microvirga sp. RSM25]|uniref:hypothetical protein n=1 Tax=Microvirga sp. RSM25 TaxID=3273802 RepID=UPI0038501BFB